MRGFGEHTQKDYICWPRWPSSKARRARASNV
jgi:hypothetical protein